LALPEGPLFADALLSGDRYPSSEPNNIRTVTVTLAPTTSEMLHITGFALAVTPTWQHVAAGQATTCTVGLSASSEFSAPVTLTVSEPIDDVIDSSWSRNPITPGMSSTLWVTTTVDALPKDNELVIVGTGDGLTDTVRLTLTVQAPSLSVGKTAPPHIVAGSQLTYTIHVSNTGNVTATSVRITDKMPVGANYVGCDGGECEEEDGTIHWRKLAVSPSDVINVTAVVSTCQSELINRWYRVITSTQSVSSDWGSVLTTTLDPPTLLPSFTLSSDTVFVGAELGFADTSTTNGSPIVTRAWHFGDGTTQTGTHVTHSYTTAGTYTVTLTITDACGYAESLIARDAIKVVDKVFLPLMLRGSD
jgi:uncharacterized repeat protein (TIGR01451 family)